MTGIITTLLMSLASGVSVWFPGSSGADDFCDAISFDWGTDTLFVIFFKGILTGSLRHSPLDRHVTDASEPRPLSGDKQPCCGALSAEVDIRGLRSREATEDR